MQAIILAAGMGRRLKSLTKYNTKCMVSVNGQTLIERMLLFLEKLNFSRIIIVVGYKAENLINYVKNLEINTEIIFIHNYEYEHTNNIFSLYLAKSELEKEDTILLESDIIFEYEMLEELYFDSSPNVAIVSKWESWMDGTVVVLDDATKVTQIIDKKHFDYLKVNEYYKTVNIYKFSKEFSKNKYIPFLEAYIRVFGNNQYYEQVLRVITLIDKADLKAFITERKWYEIDDVLDLDVAELIFEENKEQKYNSICHRYGGYWRFPKLIDFCYLVNPYFPPAVFEENLKISFSSLLTQYPSGQLPNALLAANLFDLNQDSVIVGNGAAELISAVTRQFKTAKFGICLPSFEEYLNRIQKTNAVIFNAIPPTYRYSADDLIDFFSSKKIDFLVLVNPDNPTGSYIDGDGIQKLVAWTQKKQIMLIIDESFVDFADKPYSVLNQDFLDRNKNVLVIKSISKSYGIPGVRLGIMASANTKIISAIRSFISIWNINSFGEFCLQILEKYSNEYVSSLKLLRAERTFLYDELCKIKQVHPVESQANYIMCKLDLDSSYISSELFTSYNILIKDLSKKKGITGNYVRIAIRNRQDNLKLLAALYKIFDDYYRKTK